MPEESEYSCKKQNNQTKLEDSQKRGEYRFYPPNLRDQIAKMALEKGVSKATDYFSDGTGRFVSTSTVASIRNQYFKEISNCIENDKQISELPKSNTGRPLLIEELDSHVSEFVTKIVESGRTVNSAIVKKIAREIIIANNKSLLLEYGGPFELSNAWAERMLKNMGINSKGKQITRKKVKKATNEITEVNKSQKMKETSVLSSKASPNIDSETQNDASETEKKLKESQDHDTKYKVVACPASKGKQNTRKRFHIMKIPIRNMPRSCNQKQKEKVIEKANVSVDLPDKDLLEMAIPSITGKRKRGDYATYTSEQRIKMAKMAYDIGIAKTANYFTKELGRYVSPSSIASMRNQYKKEIETKQIEISELPKGKRGRPLLLGHLDLEIKNAIEDIKIKGGKIGRNMVKSVARDIIISHNRSLLKDYGGPLQLTNTWAESVMKRMGFVCGRKNGVKPQAKITHTPSAKRIVNEFEELNQAYIEVSHNGLSAPSLANGLVTQQDSHISAFDTNQEAVIPNQEINDLNHVFPSNSHFDQTTVPFYNDWGEKGISDFSYNQDQIEILPNLNPISNVNNTSINLGTYASTTQLTMPVESHNPVANVCESQNSETNAKKTSKVKNVFKKINTKRKSNKKGKSEKQKRGEYGVYTSEQRMLMAKCALDHGVTKAAQMISDEIGRRVSSSTVASMRNLYLRELEKSNGEISELPRGKRGRPLLLGEMDQQIQKCLINIRTNGGVISRMVVVSVAREIIASKSKELLKENGGPLELSTTWAESVIRRMGFVCQKTETAEKPVPADFDKLKSAFLDRISSVVVTHSIPKQLILNFGQTALKIVPSCSWTTETQFSATHRQLPTVEIEDKREITCIITITLGGDLLPLQLIYTGKTDQCHPNTAFPEGWSIIHSDNHMCSNETVMHYADKILIPHINKTRNLLGLSPTQKALAIFDVLNMHQGKDFFTKLSENNIEVILVPTPCSHLLQPLKVVLFGRFRDELYKLFVNWYSNQVCESVRAGQHPSSVAVDLRLSVLKHLHAQWIIKGYEVMANDKNLILQGFGNTGIIQALCPQLNNWQNVV